MVFNSLPSSDKSNPKALRSAAARVVLPASPPNSQIRQRHSHIIDIFLCLQFGHQTPNIFFPWFLNISHVDQTIMNKGLNLFSVISFVFQIGKHVGSCIFMDILCREILSIDCPRIFFPFYLVFWICLTLYFALSLGRFPALAACKLWNHYEEHITWTSYSCLSLLFVIISLFPSFWVIRNDKWVISTNVSWMLNCYSI